MYTIANLLLPIFDNCGVHDVMRGTCSDCGQEIKEGEKFCSLCKKPYVSVIDDDSEPIKVRSIPTKLQISKGVLAIIISAVIAISAGAVGTWLYLQNPDTPESIALDGINVLLNADIREFAARHAFIEADIGLAIRTGRAYSWDDAVLPLVWEMYNELECVLDVLEKGDIGITVADSVELTETDKDVALNGIYNNTVGDSDDNPARADMIGSIINNVSRLYRVEIEVSEVDAETSPDTKITIHVGMIDDKWLIMSETMQ
jgi:hypothetical protein